MIRRQQQTISQASLVLLHEMHILFEHRKVYEFSGNVAAATDPDFLSNIDTARWVFEELAVSKPDLIKESVAFHLKGHANSYSKKENLE